MDSLRFAKFNIRVDEFTRLAAQRLWPDLKRGQRISMHDFFYRCVLVSEYLQDLGMRKDQYWSIQGFDSLSTLTLMFASWMNEAVTVPLNPAFNGKHLDVYLEQLDLHRRIEPSSFTEDISPISPDPSLDLFSIFKRLMETQKAQVAIFSSGTSGKPKAIVHSLASLSYSANASNRYYGLEPSDSWLMSLGLFHVGGLIIAIRCALAGATLCLGAKLSDSLNLFKPSFISLVPTQLMDLVKSTQAVDNLKLSRAILVGGAGYSDELLQMAKRYRLAVSFTYGSSETGAQVAATKPGVYPEAHKAAGQILPGRQLSISDDGHIQINDKGLMLGYWLAKDFYPIDSDDQCYRSSDLGMIKNDLLIVQGRSDDVYMVGGEGVSLSEVQLLCDQGSWGGRLYVIMQEDERLGFAPCAIIEAVKEPQTSQVLEQLNEFLPSLKRPRSVYWHQVKTLSAAEKPNRLILKAGIEEGRFKCLWRRSESD